MGQSLIQKDDISLYPLPSIFVEVNLGGPNLKVSISPFAFGEYIQRSPNRIECMEN